MNKYLQQLVELSDLDKQIDGFIPRIQDIEKAYKNIEEECETITVNIERLDEEVSDLKSQKSGTNTHIAEFSAKIKDVAKKSSSAKSEKEIKALSLEEDIAKEQLEAANEEIARLEKLIDSKNKLIATMNQKILAFYEKIRKWAHNTAVVPVKKQACYGCFMQINDKTFSAVIKGEDIVTCPHCGRILYKQEQ